MRQRLESCSSSLPKSSKVSAAANCAAAAVRPERSSPGAVAWTSSRPLLGPAVAAVTMRDSSFLLLSYCAQHAAAREGRPQAVGCLHCDLRAILVLAVRRAGARSEESRVGQEGVSTGRAQ